MCVILRPLKMNSRPNGIPVVDQPPSLRGVSLCHVNTRFSAPPTMRKSLWSPVFKSFPSTDLKTVLWGEFTFASFATSRNFGSDVFAFISKMP